MKRWILLIILILSLNIVYSDLTCDIRIGGCDEINNDEVAIFYLSQGDNSHISKTSSSTYNQYVCCKVDTPGVSISTLSTGTIIAKISAETRYKKIC